MKAGGVTPDDIALIAQQLAAVAGVFSPANAASIALVVQAAATLNILISKIRAQTEAERAEVWTEVSRDFNATLLLFQQSVDRERAAALRRVGVT